jgi:hypothetical protein
MRAPQLLTAALCLTASTFLLNDASFAGGHKPKKEKTEVRASLKPCCGEVEPAAEGKSKRKTEARATVVEKDAFEAKVHVPVPSTGLGIADEAAAESAVLHLVLSNAGGPYADCVLEFTEIETEEDDSGIETYAEYKVQLQQQSKKGVTVLKEKKGACDTDLVTADVQAGVPNVQEGDSALVSLLQPDPDPAIPFLEGVFTKKK